MVNYGEDPLKTALHDMSNDRLPPKFVYSLSRKYLHAVRYNQYKPVGNDKIPIGMIDSIEDTYRNLLAQHSFMM